MWSATRIPKLGRMPNTEEMIADIETLVCCESPSDDHAAVARSADLVAALGTRHLGFEPDRLVIDDRTHLRWRLGAEQKVLLLGHHDTVWPIGSLKSLPFGVENGVLRGPGCFDMKAGIVIAFHALAGLAGLDGFTLLVTGDEEVGSPSSRELIEQEARRCSAALVLEAAGPGGALKTERKGVSNYDVLVHGRAAHAGLEPELGVNASIESAHQILAISRLSNPTLGTTVTPTRASAGTTTNTVPAEARFAVDVRVPSAAEQDRVHTAMQEIEPHLRGTEIEVFGGPNRPPLQALSSRDLFARATRLADDLGIGPMTKIAVGGASDGNFTAGVGVPTLDGLGAVGGGAHSDDEHLIVSELPRRTKLVTALVAELLADNSATGPSAVSDPLDTAPSERRAS